MYAYKIMGKNQRNGIKYIDSYHFIIEDAQERMKILEMQDDGDDWHFWIDSSKVKIIY